jgi:hypothetical protein
LTFLNDPYVARAIRAHVDDHKPIHVILDNLNHNKNRDVHEWCEQYHVESVFTATYASWANPIEAHFGPLPQFVIANSDHADHSTLGRAIRKYLRWRNTHTREYSKLNAATAPASAANTNDDGAIPKEPPRSARTFVVRALARRPYRANRDKFR